MDLVSQYWNGVQRRLQAEVDGFNSLIWHQGELGKENELSLARVLESLVPTRYGVGSGLLFDSTGGESKQTDIVIFDAVDEPAILAQTNQILFPVENVRAAIEVKTSIDSSEVRDVGQKVASVAALSSRTEAPLLAAFGYRATQQVGTVIDHIRALKTEGQDNRPAIFLVVDPAILGLQGSLARRLGWDVPDDTDYLVGVTPRQERDESRQPLVGRYQQPKEDASRTEVVDGDTYSVHLFKRRPYLADSARALLLFCEALVTAMALADGRQPPAIHHYIKTAMRDIWRED